MSPRQRQIKFRNTMKIVGIALFICFFILAAGIIGEMDRQVEVMEIECMQE